VSNIAFLFRDQTERTAVRTTPGDEPDGAITQLGIEPVISPEPFNLRRQTALQIDAGTTDDKRVTIIVPELFYPPFRCRCEKHTAGIYHLRPFDQVAFPYQPHSAALLLEMAAELHKGQIRQAAVHVQQENGSMPDPGSFLGFVGGLNLR
jgi:hypothetical protein